MLDTHTLIWLTEGAAALSETARTILQDRGNRIFYSCVNIWEIAIKLSISKVSMSMHLERDYRTFLARNDLVELPILYAHVARVAYLPDHHRDLFDRLLIAQAQTEQLALLSKDAAFDAYGIRRLW